MNGRGRDGALCAERVGVRRAGRWVLDDVSLALAPGRVSMLIGPNGAGKSTLLRVLAGTLVPERGEARLDGQALRRWTLAQLAARRAVLPQSMELAFRVTVAELVMIGRPPRRGVRGRGAGIGAGTAANASIGIEAAPPPTDDELLASVLAATETATMRDRIYQELSGGEQARVQLARALAQLGLLADRRPSDEAGTGAGAGTGAEAEAEARDPADAGPTRYLLLDEPVASLDPRHQHRLLRLVRTLAVRHRLGMLITMHDLNLASQYADEVWLLADGRLLRHGAPSDVVSNDAIGPVFDVSLRTTPFDGDGRAVHAVATTPRGASAGENAGRNAGRNAGKNAGKNADRSGPSRMSE
ncbi:MAG: ATP-binding cassette domain-containing protein [Burkholderiaceae bacterium]